MDSPEVNTTQTEGQFTVLFEAKPIALNKTGVDGVVEDKSSKVVKPNESVSEPERELEISEMESKEKVEVQEPEAPLPDANILLEKGFFSLEAQKAYYEFVAAASNVREEKGPEADIFYAALGRLRSHFDELSLPKLVSVLGVLFKVFIIFLINRTRENISQVNSEKIQVSEIPSEE